jgi:plasmid maintenance system antidote protein VapI
MAKDIRKKIIKELIEEEKVQTFAAIFDYITKTEISRALGINYTRFRSLVDDPKRLRYEEAISIARVLGVTPRQISELIHNQVEAGKRKK